MSKQLRDIPWQRWAGATVVAPDGELALVWGRTGTTKAPTVALWRDGQITATIAQSAAKNLELVSAHPIYGGTGTQLSIA